jgi:hypothetical protein
MFVAEIEMLRAICCFLPFARSFPTLPSWFLCFHSGDILKPPDSH